MKEVMCTECGETFGVPDSLAGKDEPCPACARPVKIPSEPSGHPPPAATPSARSSLGTIGPGMGRAPEYALLRGLATAMIAAGLLAMIAGALVGFFAAVQGREWTALSGLCAALGGLAMAAGGAALHCLRDSARHLWRMANSG
jgi:hypothetical protein